MTTTPEAWRIAVVRTYFMCLYLRHFINEAYFWKTVRDTFSLDVPNHTVQDVKAYAERWVAHFNTYGHVRDDPEHRRGRRPNMPDDVAREIVGILLGGYEEKCPQVVGHGDDKRTELVTKQKWFRSIHDAVARNAFIKEALSKYNITQHTLLLRLQHVAPGLKRRHLHPRRGLSRQHRDARIEQCQKWLNMGGEKLLQYLSRVFWIDAKSFYILPKSQWVYAPHDAEMTVEDERMPDGEGEKIVYYCVVNAILGPVYIEYVTGTSEHHKDPYARAYMVSKNSTPVLQPCVLLPPCALPRLCKIECK